MIQNKTGNAGLNVLHRSHPGFRVWEVISSTGKAITSEYYFYFQRVAESNNKVNWNNITKRQLVSTKDNAKKKSYTAYGRIFYWSETNKNRHRKWSSLV